MVDTNFFDSTGGDTKVSKFNEAALKMRRLDKVQDSLNLTRINLLKPIYYQETNNISYNYEVMGSLLKSLHMEIIGKLSPSEAKEMQKLIDLIDEVLYNNPPYKEVADVMSQNGKKLVLDKKSWDMLRGLLQVTEQRLRKLIDIHGLSTPDMEEEGGWD